MTAPPTPDSTEPAREVGPLGWLEPWRVDGYKARNKVKCPFCHAPTGEKCHTGAGVRRNNHPERNYSASLELWREEKGEA